MKQLVIGLVVVLSFAAAGLYLLDDAVPGRDTVVNTWQSKAGARANSWTRSATRWLEAKRISLIQYRRKAQTTSQKGRTGGLGGP